MVFGWNRGGLAGPLRRGYSDPEAFLAEYVRPGRDPGACTPTLADSLSRLTSVGELTRRLGQLPPGALCVIEGCSTPGNLQALRSFLQGQGVADPRVIAFDLIDVPAVLRAHGVANDDENFLVSDASDLGGTFSNQSCDFFIQDHLLNCAPHAFHDSILREAARILKPGGLGLIHVTDDGALAPLPLIMQDQLESSFQVEFDPFAYGLADLGLSNGQQEAMKEAAQNRYFTRAGGHEAVLITSPHGHFEFYRPDHVWPRLIEQAGLRVLTHEIRSGRDSQGHRCRRHYFLVGRA